MKIKKNRTIIFFKSLNHNRSEYLFITILFYQPAKLNGALYGKTNYAKWLFLIQEMDRQNFI